MISLCGPFIYPCLLRHITEVSRKWEEAWGRSQGGSSQETAEDVEIRQAVLQTQESLALEGLSAIAKEATDVGASYLGESINAVLRLPQSVAIRISQIEEVLQSAFDAARPSGSPAPECPMTNETSDQDAPDLLAEAELIHYPLTQKKRPGRSLDAVKAAVEAGEVTVAARLLAESQDGTSDHRDIDAGVAPSLVGSPDAPSDEEIVSMSLNDDGASTPPVRSVEGLGKPLTRASHLQSLRETEAFIEEDHVLQRREAQRLREEAAEGEAQEAERRHVAHMKRERLALARRQQDMNTLLSAQPATASASAMKAQEEVEVEAEKRLSLYAPTAAPAPAVEGVDQRITRASYLLKMREAEASIEEDHARHCREARQRREDDATRDEQAAEKAHVARMKRARIALARR